MEIYWTLKAQDDLERIYRFALQYSRQHADDVLDRFMITDEDGEDAFIRIGSIAMVRVALDALEPVEDDEE